MHFNRHSPYAGDSEKVAKLKLLSDTHNVIYFEEITEEGSQLNIHKQSWRRTVAPVKCALVSLAYYVARDLSQNFGIAAEFK